MKQLLLLFLLLFAINSLRAQPAQSVKTDQAYELYLTQIAAAEAFLQLNKTSTARQYLDACSPEFRDLEWSFLDSYLDQSDTSIRKGGQTTFTDVQLSPDESLVAVSGSDSLITLYSFPGLKWLRELKGHGGSVSTLDFSSDGKRLVSGGRDHAVIVWEVSSGRPLITNDTAFSQGIYQVRFSPDDQQIGVVSWELRSGNPRIMGFAKILDAQSGATLQKIDTEPHPAAGIVFTNDGADVIISCWGEVAKRHHLASGRELWKYDLSDPAEYNAFHSIAISPDGQTLILGSTDHRLHLLDPRTGKLQKRIEPWEGHTKTIKTIQYNAGSKWIASAGEDQSILVWDAADYQQKFKLIGHTKTVTGMAWSRDGNKLLSVSADGSLKLWDINAPFQISYEICNYGPWQAPVSPDGTTFAAPCSDERLAIYELKSGKTVLDLGAQSGLCADYSADGRYLATSSFDGVVRLWSLPEGNMAQAFAGHSGRVDGVTFLDRLPGAASVGDNSLRIWKLGSAEALKTITFENDPFRVVSNEDGSLLFAGFSDGTIKTYRTTDWKEINSFPSAAGLNELRVSPDGRYLAAINSKQITVLDARAGHQLYVLTGHEQTSYGLDFSPDSRYLISGSYDQTFKFWNLENGRCTLTFHGYEEIIYTTQFGRQRELLIGSAEGRMRYYKF